MRNGKANGEEWGMGGGEQSLVNGEWGMEYGVKIILMR